MRSHRLLPLLLLSLFFYHCAEDDLSDVREISIGEMLTDDYEISMNPSGRNALSVRIKTKTSLPSEWRATVVGNHPLTFESKEVGEDISMDIFGLYPGRSNKIALRFSDNENRWAKDTIQLDIPALPDHLPGVEVLENRRMDANMTLVEFSVGNDGVFESQPLLIDRNGEIRMHLDLTYLGGIAFPVKVLDNGNIITARQDRIIEYNWMGEEVNEWRIPGYNQHHEIVETSNNTFIIAVDKGGLSTIEDHIIEIDRNSGAVVREWDLRQLLDVDRFDLIENERDWFHMNAIWYIEEEDAIITSGRNQGVVKISGDNELLWILAPHKGWGKAGINGDGFETSDFLLTAVDEEGNPYKESIQQGDEEANDFAWSWGQHAPMMLENGNLFLFDNGFNRTFNGNETFSRGVEYAIDEENMTIRQVWQFGKERGPDFFSAIISDVDVNAIGNRVITAGIINEGGPSSTIVEVDAQGEVWHEIELSFKNAFVNGSGWGNLDLCYRSEQVDLGL